MVTKLDDLLHKNPDVTQANTVGSEYLEKPKLIKFGPVYQTVCVECECLFGWQKHHLKKDLSACGLNCPGCDVFLTSEQLKHTPKTPDTPVKRNNSFKIY